MLARLTEKQEDYDAEQNVYKYNVVLYFLFVIKHTLYLIFYQYKLNPLDSGISA